MTRKTPERALPMRIHHAPCNGLRLKLPQAGTHRTSLSGQFVTLCGEGCSAPRNAAGQCAGC